MRLCAVEELKNDIIILVCMQGKGKKNILSYQVDGVDLYVVVVLEFEMHHHTIVNGNIFYSLT